MTGYARHSFDDGGQLIGGHFRATAYKAASQVWGSWSYAASGDPATVPISLIRTEIDMNNENPDQGWMVGADTNNSRGLLIVTADCSNPITHALYIGNGKSAPSGQIHTGILFKGGGIALSLGKVAGANISSTEVADNEAIRLEGAATGSTYTGIRFRSGAFRTGITFTESNFESNAAILLGDGQSIVVSAGPASNSYLNFNATNALANFNNFAIAINGSRVVGIRKSGWGTPTGTTARTSSASSAISLPDLAAQVSALIIDLKSHGLLGD